MPLSTSDISLCLVLSSEGMAVNSWLILYIDTTVIGAKDFLRGCLVSHSRRLLTGDCSLGLFGLPGFAIRATRLDPNP